MSVSDLMFCKSQRLANVETKLVKVDIMADNPTDQDRPMPTVDFVLVKSPSKTKLFISHSSADESLASALVDLLLSSILLEDSDIRCTSVPGHKLPVGSDFASTPAR